MEDNLVLQTAGATELNLPIAGLGSRSYAFIIDWHFRLVLALAWVFGSTLASGRSFGNMFTSFSSSTAFMWIVVIPAFAIYFLYHPVLEIVMRGRTPGKRLTGIRIVTTQGQTPGYGPLLIRNIFRLIDSLPFCYVVGLSAVVMTARQVRIGDLAAGTLLVYEEKTAALDQTLALAATSHLGQTDLELLQDLLERWDDLERDPRDRLAAKFLAHIGDPAIPTDPNGDEILHTRLKALLEESRGVVAR